jgi:hypothetical protein
MSGCVVTLAGEYKSEHLIAGQLFIDMHGGVN